MVGQRCRELTLCSRLGSQAIRAKMPLMTTFKINSKGQVRLNDDMLAHLGARPGDKLRIDKLPGGRLQISAERRTGKMSDFFGMLRQENGPHLTIEEINEAIADGWAGKR